MSTTLLGWTEKEWRLALLWAKGRGLTYPPTLQGGSKLQDDWRAAHEPPPSAEAMWFAQFRKTLES